MTGEIHVEKRGRTSKLKYRSIGDFRRLICMQYDGDTITVVPDTLQRPRERIYYSLLTAKEPMTVGDIMNDAEVDEGFVVSFLSNYSQPNPALIAFRKGHCFLYSLVSLGNVNKIINRYAKSKTGTDGDVWWSHVRS